MENKEGRTLAGADNMHGFYYQTAVSIHYYCLGRKLKNFHFIPEAKDAGVFDDIVFHYVSEEAEKKYCLIQVKHTLPEKGNGIKKITSEELLAEKGNFALSKYFKCFVEDLPKFLQGVSIEHLIVFTRRDFDIHDFRKNHITVSDVQSTCLIPKNSYMLRIPPDISRRVIRNADLKSDNETSSKLLDKFLGLLVFAVNQPDYKELDNVVKEEVGRVFNLNEPENGNVFDKMLGRMWTLQATKDHKEKTPTSIDDEFNNHVKDITDKYFYGITFSTRKDKIELEDYFTETESMTKSLISNDQPISRIFSDTPTLTCLKVAQTLMNIYKHRDYPELYFAIVDLSTLQHNMGRLQNTFNSKKEFILVIKCDKQYELAKVLTGLLVQAGKPEKKIVLVCSDRVCQQIEFYDFCEFHEMCNVEKFLKTAVNMQDEEIILEDIINATDFGILKSNVAICDEIVEFGKLCIEQKMDNFESIESYYIELLFKKNFKYHESLLRNIPEKIVFVFSGFEKPELENLLQNQKLLVFAENDTEIKKHNAILLSNKKYMDKDFDVICSKLKSEDVHWLVKKNNYVLVNKSVHNVTVTMDALITESKHVNVVIGQPGSGKSVAITKIMNKIKRCNHNCPKRWTIKINLLSFSKNLEELRKQGGQIDEDATLDFLCQAEGMKKCWQKELLRHAMKKPEFCQLFFDGFDEICPKYETIVLQILRICKNTEATIWVTSRSQFQITLENELNCSSYSPIAFSSAQQNSFFKKYWRNALGSSLESNSISEMFTITRRFQGTRIKFAEELIGIPLHTLMIADISIGIYRSKINGGNASNSEVKFKDIDNILSLYNIFVDEKFVVYCKEKTDYCDGSSGIAYVSRDYASMMHKNAALQLLFPEDLTSLHFDLDGEAERAEEIQRIGLFIKNNDQFHFHHRTFAEYFIAKRLGEILTDRKRYKENGVKYATVIRFLKEQYFAETNRMIRIFLDLAVVSADIHKAIINNDQVTAIRLVKANEACIWQPDFLGRAAAHLSALYSVSIYQNDYPFFDFKDSHFIFDVLQHIFDTVEKKICQTDKLEFNVLCYAIVAACQDRSHHSNFRYLLNEMMKTTDKPEILYEIISNITQMDCDIEQNPQLFCDNIKKKIWEVFDFKMFFANNKNDFIKLKSLMRMAKDVFPWKFYCDEYIKDIIYTGQNFRKLLADKYIDLSYLKNENFIRREDFKNWFKQAKEKKDCKSLREFFKFFGCPTVFTILYKPSVKFKKNFESALAMVKETFDDVDMCINETRCDNYVVHLEKVLYYKGFYEFEELLDTLNDEMKKDVFDKLHFAKVANTVTKSGISYHLQNLILMPIYQTDIEKMKSGIDYQNQINYFKDEIKYRWSLKNSIFTACISDQEKQRVEKILNHTLHYEQDSMYTEESYQSNFEQSLKLEWLNCYPLQKPSDFHWSLWEHLYCLVICQENQWRFPPDILSSLQPEYISKILEHKNDFQSVRHIFQLATEEQKIQICKSGGSWEFLLHAICNYFDEITNEKCAHGRYLRKIQNEIPVEEKKFKAALTRLLVDDLTTLARIITFFSGMKQVAMFRTYCIPEILRNVDSFHLVKHIFQMATDEQKTEICRHNDWEFFLHAISKYFNEIMIKNNANVKYLEAIQNEMPLEHERFQKAFACALDGKYYNSTLKFILILKEDNQSKLWSAVYKNRIKILERKILEQDENIDVEFLLHVMAVATIMNNAIGYDALIFPFNVLKQFSYEQLNDLLWYLKPDQYSEAMKKMDFALRFQEAIWEKDFTKLNEMGHKLGYQLMRFLMRNVDPSSCVSYLKHMIVRRCREGVMALLEYMGRHFVENEDFEFTLFLYRYKIDHGEFFDLSVDEENTLLSLLNEYTVRRYPEINVWRYIQILFGSLTRSRGYVCKIDFKNKILQDIAKLTKLDFKVMA